MYNLPDQGGRVAVVTGANSGVGKEAARRLADAGAYVVMAVRTPAAGERARAELLRRNPDALLEVRRLDLADQASVREFAAGLVADGLPVDLLLNNAGVMAPPARTVTADGFELQMATNFLGPYALTVRLLPALLVARAPRVVFMSSGVADHGRIDFDDLQWEHRRYSDTRSYMQSKLAVLMLSQRLAALAADRGWNLLSAAAHPGYTRTNLLTSGPSLGRDKPKRSLFTMLGFLPSQDVTEGAGSLLYAATSSETVPGGYYGPGGRLGLVGPTVSLDVTPKARDAVAGQRLWAEAERLTGVVPMVSTS
ncbi:SDR family oxidoreductase [Streptomyces sp. NPDC058464]|uniref:SDR family oxidoreductase n=1 Tax=Streptomyces sp. NPDC058464 TaxID=3346511 RepID=UPI003660AD8D